MQNNRRKAGAGLALLAVVTIVLIGWFWLRPWWQERSLTQALGDIPGVASVEAAPEDATFDEHPYVLRFSDGISAAQLASSLQAVEGALDDHEIAGDRAAVEMSVDDFVLEPPRDGTLSADVLGAVLALRDVKGLTGISVNDHQITLSAADNADLVPAAVEALDALAAAHVFSADDATIRLVTRRGNGALRATLSGAARQAAVLKGLNRVVTRTGAELRTVDSPGMSVSTFARPGRAVECDAELTLQAADRVRATARVVAREAPQCGVELAVGDDPENPFSLRLQPGSADPDPGLALRDRLERIGATVTRVNSDLGFIAMSIEDADGLDALRKLTLDPSRWTAPADASLTVRWAGTSWNAFEFKPVSVLQRLGAAMADVRRAGLVASSTDQTGTKNQLTVSDDVKGAPDLTTPEGRQAAVRAIRVSGFPGSVKFRIASGQAGVLAFTATAGGRATNVLYPEESPITSWAPDFIDDWNKSAG